VKEQYTTVQEAPDALNHAFDCYRLSRQWERRRRFQEETENAEMFAERARAWFKEANCIAAYLGCRIVRHPNRPDQLATELQANLIRLASRVTTGNHNL